MVLGIMSNNAREAVNLHWLREDDVILANERELLYVAKQQAIAMSESNYQPPLSTEQVKVLGKTSAEKLMTTLDSFYAHDGPQPHDVEIAHRIANCLTGGDIDADTLISQEQLLTLERNNFIKLIQKQQTIDRIEHMLNTGKRWRN
jgi:3-hydroxyacyl-CoA dehydrogenase